MKKTKDSKAGMIIVEIYNEGYAKNKAYIPSKSTVLSQNGIKRVATGGFQWIIKEDHASIDPKLLLSLSAGQLAMVSKIIAELKRFNAFWYFDYRAIGGKDERVIGQLRKKRILFKTEDISLHIVNPLMIKRGGFTGVIAATSKLISVSNVIDKKLYKHLENPDESDFGYYSLQTN